MEAAGGKEGAKEKCVWLRLDHVLLLMFYGGVTLLLLQSLELPHALLFELLVDLVANLVQLQRNIRRGKV